MAWWKCCKPLIAQFLRGGGGGGGGGCLSSESAPVTSLLDASVRGQQKRAGNEQVGKRRKTKNMGATRNRRETNKSETVNSGLSQKQIEVYVKSLCK